MPDPEKVKRTLGYDEPKKIQTKYVGSKPLKTLKGS